LTQINAANASLRKTASIDATSELAMDTTEILFLGLLLTAFTAFIATVGWVLHDDARNTAKRAANEATASVSAVDMKRAA
jgi:hypothetical protein